MASHDRLNDVMNALPGDLFCKTGILSELTKAPAERALSTERDGHLSEARARALAGPPNRRNGGSRKTVTTDSGKVVLDMPRGRYPPCGTVGTERGAGYHRRHGAVSTVLRSAQGADYLLALKGNRKSLHEEGRLYFDQALEFHETTDADHGRLEVRRAWVGHDVDWLRPDRAEPGAPRFVGLTMIGMMEAEVEHKGRTRVALFPVLRAADRRAARHVRALGRRKPPALGDGCDLSRQPHVPAHSKRPCKHGTRSRCCV